MQHDTTAQHIVTITLSFAQLQERICCDSAWYCTARPGATIVTPDQHRSTLRHVGHAYHELLSHLGGWLLRTQVNTTLERDNLLFTLQLRHEPTAAFAQTMQQALAEAITAHVLMHYYPGNDTSHAASWRKHVAQARLLLARDSMLDATQGA